MMDYEANWKELREKAERAYGAFRNLAQKEAMREKDKEKPNLKEWARLTNKAEGVYLVLQYMFDCEMEGLNDTK